MAFIALKPIEKQQQNKIDLSVYEQKLFRKQTNKQTNINYEYGDRLCYMKMMFLLLSLGHRFIVNLFIHVAGRKNRKNTPHKILCRCQANAKVPYQIHHIVLFRKFLRKLFFFQFYFYNYQYSLKDTLKPKTNSVEIRKFVFVLIGSRL